MQLNECISPILCGGLGNNLFQIATAIAYSKDTGIPTIFGYWTSHNSKMLLPENHVSQFAGKPNPYFQKWGGWQPKNSALSIHTMFPNLQWFDNPDPTVDGDYNVINENFYWSFHIDTGTGGVYEPLVLKPGTQFYGYFFNHKYWHHQRAEILKQLQFNLSDVEYVKNKYGQLLQQATVSINVRMHDIAIPGDHELDDRKVLIDQRDFILQAMRVFGLSRTYVITSDRVDWTKQMMSEPEFKRYNTVVIDEDFDHQLILSTLCQDHILTNSTFSFWACYLDPEIEKHRVVYQSTFKQLHSDQMIPYKWIELRWNKC